MSESTPPPNTVIRKTRLLHMSSKGHQYSVYSRVAPCVQRHEDRAIAVMRGSLSKVAGGGMVMGRMQNQVN